MAKKKKTAFITGVTGQDGAWLAKLLLDKGYKVYGGVRWTSRNDFANLNFLGVTDKIELVDFDLCEYSNIYNTIKSIKPDEFYNLAAISFVAVSFEQPILVGQTNAIGVANILDILVTLSPKTKFYQASTSEMFGKVQETPQTEKTPFYPQSPYAISKLYAHWTTVNYRESYDMFCVSGILFNHESELRGEEFVTRKIPMNVAKWATGKKEVLELGNMNTCRDWGYAKEYVEGMWRMLQAKKPDTYVLATGKTTKIRDFVDQAFMAIGKNLQWKGKGKNEKGYDKKTGELIVRVNPKFFRPSDVDLLIGDASKARKILGWSPKTGLAKLTKLMVANDIKLLKK